jgi:hypothetical protein
MLTWGIAMARTAGRPLDALVVDATRRAGRFLQQLMDPDTGSVPLCGWNDGAHVLPLTAGPFLDFRPAVQTAGVVCDGVAPLPGGPWDEAVGWLNTGRRAAWEGHRARGDVFSAPMGGWHVIRRGDGRAFVRAVEEFRHRPAQADLLHVDIWWGRQPVTRDPGTYSYHCGGAFADGFRTTRVHNTVEVDGESQMASVGRFLYLPWPRGTVQVDMETLALQASHGGYERCGVDHRRVVRADDPAGWVVEDELVSASTPHAYRLHWLLADWPYRYEAGEGELVLQMPEGRYCVRWEAEPPPERVTVVRADPHSDRGWWSPHYLHVEPALSLEVVVDSTSGARFRTAFRPGG